ncbi:MAG: monovalent cation/H(+) antiporter subunit G [Nocardia sp.]|nr:monovalent cation/H(+) antiporter subunit G [Nocardia sp.]
MSGLAGALLTALSALMMLLGAVLNLTAAIALVRFPNTLTRMHAATKPQVTGLILILLGAALRVRGHPNVWMLLLAALFVLITAPAIAHLVGRTAYREQRHRDGMLLVNELGDEGMDEDR